MEDSKLARFLAARYRLALVLVAFVVIAGQVFIQLDVTRLHDDGKIVNLAGRQRMLSQRISKAALVISLSTDSAEIASRKQELSVSLDEWETAQPSIRSDGDRIGLTGVGGVSIGDLYDRAEPFHDATIAAGRRILADQTETSTGGFAPDVRIILDNEPKFLELMNQIVFAYQDSSTSRVTNTQVVQLAFAIAVLALLVFLWRYVMRPTTRRVAEDVLELEKLSVAVENASDHIVITDAEGVLIYANAAVERITGFSKTETLGKKAGSKELWGGGMGAPFYRRLWKTIKTEKKVFREVVRNHRKDGSLYSAEIAIAPVIGPDGKAVNFVGIERDVTKEIEVDKAKSEFVSLAAHQLRTPITTIKWFIESLIDGDAGKLNRKQVALIREVSDANVRMGDLVDDFLNVSRIELGTFLIASEPLDLGATVVNSTKDLRPMLQEKRLKLELDVPKKFVFKADRGLLEMVVFNLVSNAVKYSRDGGLVSVRAAVDKKTRRVTIEVKDDGIGIPKNQQAMIFKKLFRADNARVMQVKGTGLGLYIVKSVVETAGGQIGFESEEGKGSIFRISFPLSGMKNRKGEKRLT